MNMEKKEKLPRTFLINASLGYVASIFALVSFSYAENNKIDNGYIGNITLAISILLIYVLNIIILSKFLSKEIESGQVEQMRDLTWLIFSSAGYTVWASLIMMFSISSAYVVGPVFLIILPVLITIAVVPYILKKTNEKN